MASDSELPLDELTRALLNVRDVAWARFTIGSFPAGPKGLAGGTGVTDPPDPPELTDPPDPPDLADPPDAPDVMAALSQMVSAARQTASEHWAWLLDQRQDQVTSREDGQWQGQEQEQEHSHQHDKLQVGGGRLTPISEIERYGVRVVEEIPGPLDDHYIHFAAFDPTARWISVSMASVHSVTAHLELAGLSQALGSISVLDVVLWHEYFHVWSHATRTAADKNAERARVGELAKPWRRFGLRRREFTLQRTGAALDRKIEELAAVEFSRQACGLSVHPQLLQWLLIYSKDPRLARELARNVLGKSW
ncbi:hypothetical protein JZ785_20915 [Alicyclobacillus curvatus]|nr:hypothetical protein JZ785_20915 [Alicyclobacillus curvatus]